MSQKTRTELIASYGYGDEAASLAEAPAPPNPEPAEAGDEGQILAAIEAAIAAQEADEDVATDPNDAKTLDLLKQALEAHLADVAAEAPQAAPPAKAAPPVGTPKGPAKPAAHAAAGVCTMCGGSGKTSEGKVCAMCNGSGKLALTPGPEAPGKAKMPTQAQADKKGPENGDVCQNQDCGHTAAMHANEQGGDNVGACTAPDCKCPNFQTEEEASSGEPGTPNLQAAMPGTPPGAAPTEGEPKTQQNAPPPVEGGENMGASFVIPVGIIEGQETGDGRMIAPGALTWREPPMPLMLLTTSPHDPSGMSPNDPAVIAGRIDSLERVDGEGGTQVICAKGFCLPNEDGQQLAQLCESMGRLGVSGDVAVDATEITGVEMDPDMPGLPLNMNEQITEGTIMGFTACPFPAFEGAYMVLGDGTEEAPAAIAQRSPEKSAEAKQTPPLAASIHFMAYEECVPCQEGFDIITAAGGPVRPPAAWFADPDFVVGDDRLVEILDKRGNGDAYACPLTVTEDGRVYGHIAPWGVCHTGKLGTCVTAPHTTTDYAYFRLGEIQTAEGEHIKVGKLTADVGHATTQPGVMGFTAPEAIAHYDNSALQVAYVNIGEDEFGIWVAGAVAPTATEEQVQKLRASSISGDWRGIGGKPELVAALCVNQPGFPLAVVAHGQQALVAAGASVMAHLKDPRPSATGLPQWAEGPLLELAAQRARERVQALG